MKSGLIKKFSVSRSGIDENNFYEIEVGLLAVIMDIVSFSIRPTFRPAQDLTTAGLLNTLPVR